MAKSHPQGPSRNGSSAPGAPGHPGVTGPLFVGMNQLSPPPSTPMPPEACAKCGREMKIDSRQDFIPMILNSPTSQHNGRETLEIDCFAYL